MESVNPFCSYSLRMRTCGASPVLHRSAPNMIYCGDVDSWDAKGAQRYEGVVRRVVVDCDTLGGEGLGSLQGLDAHGEFDIDIGCDSGQFLSLGYHSVRIESHDLCGYGAVSEDLGDLLDAGGGVGVLLGYETGVGGDSVEDPPAVDLLDHVEICSVYEYLHLIISSC